MSLSTLAYYAVMSYYGLGLGVAGYVVYSNLEFLIYQPLKKWWHCDNQKNEIEMYIINHTLSRQTIFDPNALDTIYEDPNEDD